MVGRAGRVGGEGAESRQSLTILAEEKFSICNYSICCCGLCKLAHLMLLFLGHAKFKNIFIAFAVLQGTLPPAWYYLFLTLHLQLKPVGPVGGSVVQHLPKSVCEC